MNIKNFLFYLIIFNLFSNVLNGSDVYLKNKDWLKKENLTAPIKLVIDGKEADLEKDVEKIVKYFQHKLYDYDLLPNRKRSSKNEIKYVRQLKNNRYDLHISSDFVQLPLDLTWTENPFQDRLWQLKLHTLRYIRKYLMLGYIESKDIWYIDRLKFIATDWWIDNFKPNFPSKEFSWYNHAVPLRLDAYMKIFEFLRRNNALDNKSTIIILRAIYWHARILAEEEPFYMKNHNHGLDQAYNLFKASQFFPEFILSKQWENISRTRLKNEMLFALTNEGIQKENSPEYHMFYAPYLFSINDFAIRYTKKSIIKSSKNMENGGLRFITAITRPDGTLPEIGDTKSGIHTKLLYKNIETLPYFPYYQYVISGGKLGKKPIEKTFAFPETGYYIYRDKWDKAGENKATQLIMKCGFLTITHRHNDDGNILLYGFGEDWLIDAGIYGYVFNDYRKYVMSASAHNVSFPYKEKIGDLRDRYRTKLIEKRFSVYKDNWGIIESDDNHAICESHMFDGFTYTRKLKITGERAFSLSDSLVAEDHESQKKKIFMTTFRVPDDKEVYINPAKKIIMVSNTLASAGLEIHYNKDFENINLYRGENDEITSLKTAKWQSMEPIKTIAFVDYTKSYSADFGLKLVKSPSLKGFYGLPINNNILGEYVTKIFIQDHDKDIIFSVKSKFKNIKVAFYLYKDNKKIGLQGYSKNFSYKLDKQKYGAGKYRVGYFIVDEKEKYPGKAKKIESGFSEYATVQ